MGKRKVFLRGLFVVGLVAVLCAYGLATEQSANKNQGAANKNQGAANENQGAASQPNQAKTQPGMSQPRAPSSQMAQAMTLARTTDLIGKQVKSTQGENLGVIHDIVLSSRLPAVSYVALSYGGVFGINSRLYAIPWQALRVGPKGDITMSATKDQFTQAPGFTNRNWPSQADTRWFGARGGDDQALPQWVLRRQAPRQPIPRQRTPRRQAHRLAFDDRRFERRRPIPGRSVSGRPVSAATGQSQTGQSSAAAGQSQAAQVAVLYVGGRTDGGRQSGHPDAARDAPDGHRGEECGEPGPRRPRGFRHQRVGWTYRV